MKISEPINPDIKFAVVIPAYNCDPWIERAINSVLVQGCDNLVLIVVDDGSTDGTAARARSFGDHIIFRGGPNRGACHARNLGMAVGKENGATHVLFLDADDYLEGDMLFGAAKTAMEERADIVLSNMHILHYDGQLEQRYSYSTNLNCETFFSGWMKGDYVNPSAVLWRIEFVDRIGGWDETLARWQDTDISLRAMFFHPIMAKNARGAAIQVKVNHDSLSQSISHRATDSRMRVTLGLLDRVDGTSFEIHRPHLMRNLYALSRLSFRMGYVDLGRKGVLELARRGFRDHPGSLLHRTVSGVLGLEMKVRLWGT